MNAQDLLSALHQQGASVAVDADDLLISLPEDGLDPHLMSLLKERKSDILGLLRMVEDGGSPNLTPVKHGQTSAYDSPVSLAQQRILFMEELAGDASYYNMPTAYRISGHIDRVALGKALSQLIMDHDVLRSIYIRKNHSYFRRVCDPAPMMMTEHDLSQEDDQRATLRRLLAKDADYRFNLETDWPIMASLIRLSETQHVLSINIHHIAADGWSARRIISDISAHYTRYSGKSCENMGDGSGYQYYDYVVWQEAWLYSEHFQTLKNYWLSTLKGMPHLHSLPTDYPRPVIQDVSGSTYVQQMSSSLSAQLLKFSRQHRVTPFVIFESVFAALLARYSGENEVIFGTAVANRQPVEFINTVGLFVNTVVLRHRLSGGITFSDLIQQSAQVSGDAFRHQSFPFDALVDELNPPRSLAYNPLVQIMLVMQEGRGGLHLNNADVVQLPQYQRASKFDFTLHVCPSSQGIRLEWEYNSSLFSPATIRAMAENFGGLLDACLTRPQRAIEDIPLPRTQTAMTVDAKAFPPPMCIHQLFESRVVLNADATAIRDGVRKISYKELDEQSTRIANGLYRAGGAASRIGVCMGKSADLIASLLAIWKLGGVYVPLDPCYPEERLAFMIRDSGVQFILAGAETDWAIEGGSNAQLLKPESLAQTSSAAEYPTTECADRPAYIIYTSGSTGTPKGVLVSHRSLCYSLWANSSVMELNHEDSLPTIGSQAFGVSLLEILLPLISGGEVVIVERHQVMDMQRLLQVTNDVTVLHAVPSLMRQWLEAVVDAGLGQYPKLRLLLVGGEPVPDSLLQKIRQWRPKVRILGLYGMTESAVVCSSYDVDEGAAIGHSIGRPHKNVCFYVLSGHGQVQPVGVPGDLYIGGLSLAEGYINQPQVTDEKFTSCPFLQGQRLYHTGDRVRLLDNGNYEFLGRTDHQVSLRGARIELGEIEALAERIPGVKQAIAHVLDLGDEKTLVLSYTSCDGTLAGSELTHKIRSYLGQQLPDYMRPSVIQCLDAFPLNPNGKVDRKQLPTLAESTDSKGPTTDIEVRVSDLWKSVLGRENISVTDNFFEIGGHSLMATKLATKIRAEFSIAFPLATVFELPSIQACSVFIESAIKRKYAESLVREDPGQDSSDHEELLI